MEDLKLESVYRSEVKFAGLEAWLLERFPTVPRELLNLKVVCRFFGLPIIYY